MLGHHIKLQEQEHSASRVNCFLLGGQQLEFWRSELDVRLTHRSPALLFAGHVLESACGLSATNLRRRMVPSAGARYPIDHLVVTVSAGKAQAYVYSVQQRGLLALKAHTAQALAATHEVVEGQVVIVIVAVLWRTVERYGVRGARYCLIEAGYAASSIVETCFELAPDQPTPAVRLCAPEQDVFDGAVTIAAISLHEPGSPAVRHAPRVMVNRPQWPSSSPWYSENAIRVGRFYRDARRLVCEEELGVRSATRSARRGIPWQEGRSSCKGFSARPLPDEQRLALESFLLRLTTAFDGQVPLLAMFDRAGESFVPGWCNHPRRLTRAAAAIAEVWTACNNQPVTRDAGALLVMAASDDVTAPGSQALAAYYRSLLQIGVCSADVYRVCAVERIGTTMVCGFHDQALANALGLQGLRPLALHAFGWPAEQSLKTDTAYVTANEEGLGTCRHIHV